MKFNVNLRDLSFSVKFYLNCKTFTSFWSLWHWGHFLKVEILFEFTIFFFLPQILLTGKVILRETWWNYTCSDFSVYFKRFVFNFVGLIFSETYGLGHKAAKKCSITFSFNICSMWIWRWKDRGKNILTFF